MQETSSGSISFGVDRLIHTNAIEFSPDVSPDGRYIAYQLQDQDGLGSLFGRSRRSMTGDGRSPPTAARNRDGHETAVNCSTSTRRRGSRSCRCRRWDGRSSTGVRQRVLDRPYAGPFENAHPYDVSADGQRFVMIKEDATAAAARTGFTVVLNWLEELKTKMP